MPVRKNNYPKGMLLDVGCRDRKQPNFVGIDGMPRPGVDIVHNLEKFPYPIDDESCITIKCAHYIEHVKPWLVIDFMNELWRMLLPDGQLAISAPYAGSPAYMQDPTHCTMITEKTWQYFSKDSPLFYHYAPKPWVIEHLAYKPDGNIEVIMRKFKTDDVIVDITTKALSVGALQKPSELFAFLNFIKNKKLDTVVEIGTAKGGVFHALCQLASDKATVVSIDMDGGQFGGEGGLPDARTIKSFGKKKQNIHVIRGDSHLDSTKKTLSKILFPRHGGINGISKLNDDDKLIDLLFIDGDHSYSGVKKDWQMYVPFVRSGGYVIFHDICFHPQVLACEVERFWKEIKTKRKILEFIDPNDQTWGGIGVVEI